MSKNQRKQYGSAFKTKVALEALRGEETFSVLSSEYGIGQTQISNWKQQAIERIQEGFSRGKAHQHKSDDAHIKELHAKIGQLSLEKDFLERASKVLLG